MSFCWTTTGGSYEAIARTGTLRQGPVGLGLFPTYREFALGLAPRPQPVGNLNYSVYYISINHDPDGHSIQCTVRARVTSERPCLASKAEIFSVHFTMIITRVPEYNPVPGRTHLILIYFHVPLRLNSGSQTRSAIWKHFAFV